MAINTTINPAMILFFMVYSFIVNAMYQLIVSNSPFSKFLRTLFVANIWAHKLYVQKLLTHLKILLVQTIHFQARIGIRLLENNKISIYLQYGFQL